MLDTLKKTLSPLSATIVQRKMALLAHIIRAPRADPMKRVTFYGPKLQIISPAVRRTGQPKKHWTDESMAIAWDRTIVAQLGSQAYTATEEQRKAIAFQSDFRIL